MLVPSKFSEKEISAMDRAYINYEKFEEFMRRNVNDVTKMKKNLTETPFDFIKMTTEGKMKYREQVVVFRKGETRHIARTVTYLDIKRKTAQINVTAY